MITEYACECTHRPTKHAGETYACDACDCPRFTPDLQRASNAAGLVRLERGLAELEATNPGIRTESTSALMRVEQERDEAQRITKDTEQAYARQGVQLLKARTDLALVRQRAEQAQTVVGTTRKLLVERTAQLTEAQAGRDKADENAAQWMRATYTARAELASARTELDHLRADRRTWSETDA